ncbi:MAG: DUF1188 domain-containing protein [Methanospirillum sp.]|uniref:SAM-dependent methyltransferase HcgC family protein n=1 Tax=Methanospirillum sp. TaxID=45200 RepID=UPI00236BB47A|nr:SAM-dependent methyltransferase HcgC family protein [Methanospirillum sp.]MDD1728267.1 DUF1188 domain-containing protein [Methanospirillum sp.]
MNNYISCEEGITPTVTTIFSQTRITDIMDQITGGKVHAVHEWLNNQEYTPERCLIIGAYLTGAKLAASLKKTASVTVFDQYPHLGCLVDPDVSYVSCSDDLKAHRWDLIVDTTGLGGISSDILGSLSSPALFVVEDPCSEGSDETIIKTSQCQTLLQKIPAQKRGRLFTSGLATKTSGTMTLTAEVLGRSIRDATKQEGVLYSTAPLDHYERILFKEKDYETFLKKIYQSALIVSSLVNMDCDKILTKNLSCICSKVIDFEGDDT